MLSLAFTLIKLAIQTGSCKALRLEGCSVHVLPKSLSWLRHGYRPGYRAYLASIRPALPRQLAPPWYSCGLSYAGAMFSAVFAIHNAGVGHTGSVDKLDRKTKVPSCIVMPRPGLAIGNTKTGLYLRRDVDRFAPRLTIVLTFHEHKLGGLVRCHSRHGVPPSPFVTHTMRPCGYYPDRIGLFVYQDRWVSHAVLSGAGHPFV